MSGRNENGICQEPVLARQMRKRKVKIPPQAALLAGIKQSRNGSVETKKRIEEKKLGYVLAVLFLAAAGIFAAKYYMLRRQLKSISKQLGDEGVRLVTIELADESLEEIARNINSLLERIRQTIIRENSASAALKASIANISHDMKTPLTSVIGYLQLADKECTDGHVREMIGICLERTKYCNDLINDFFELSQVESQGCNPDMETIDVAGELCEQILANHPIFEEKGITPYFEDSGKTVPVSADKNMLRRIIQNLISNSIKYTCGDIYFEITVDKYAIITVSNPVLGEIDTERIFDKFYVQDESRHSGYGIGLYLCRQFAEAMGGSISAEMTGNRLNIYLKLLRAGLSH